MTFDSTHSLQRRTSRTSWLLVMAAGLFSLASCTQSAGGSCGDNEVLKSGSCVSENRQQSQDLSALLLDAGLTRKDLTDDNLRLDDGTLKVAGDSFVVNASITKLSEALGGKSAIVAFYFSGGYQKDESGVMQTWAKRARKFCHPIGEGGSPSCALRSSADEYGVMTSCHGKTKAPHVLAAAVSMKDGKLVIKFLEDLVDHHKGIKEIIKGGSESFVAAKVSESPSVFSLGEISYDPYSQTASVRNYRTKSSQTVEVVLTDNEESHEVEMRTLDTEGQCFRYIYAEQNPSFSFSSEDSVPSGAKIQAADDLRAKPKLWIDVLGIVDHDGSGITVPTVDIIAAKGGSITEVSSDQSNGSFSSEPVRDARYRPETKPPTTSEPYTSGVSLEGGSLKYLLSAISLELAGHMKGKVSKAAFKKSMNNLASAITSVSNSGDFDIGTPDGGDTEPDEDEIAPTAPPEIYRKESGS